MSAVPVATSAPSSGSDFDCSGGLDNGLLSLLDLAAGFAGDMRPQIDHALDAGKINLLLDLLDPRDDGSPFRVRVLRGAPGDDNQVVEGTDGATGAPTFDWPICDIRQQDGCELLVDPESFGPDCATAASTFQPEIGALPVSAPLCQ